MSKKPIVKLYTKSYCPFCDQAKSLLSQYGATIEEISLDDHPELMPELLKRTKMRTVPQIFIGEELIGGYDDLRQLHDAGELKVKLT